MDYSDVELSEDISYPEYPVTILDRQVRKLRTKEVPLVKVQWSRHGVEEATWETEESMRARYPELFTA